MKNTSRYKRREGLCEKSAKGSGNSIKSGASAKQNKQQAVAGRNSLQDGSKSLLSIHLTKDLYLDYIKNSKKLNTETQTQTVNEFMTEQQPVLHR